MDGLYADCPEDDKAWLEGGLDGTDVTEGENIGVVEMFGDAVCPVQFPLVIETSSIAKSPV